MDSATRPHPTDRAVRIVGAPADYGANRRGVDMGPSAIRYAGLADKLDSLGLACSDAGDLLAPPAEVSEADEEQPPAGSAAFLGQVRDVCSRLADEVAAIHADGEFPLVLGGDHSVAIGTLRGSARETDLGVLWFDAHGDFNTPETSPSGNIHGMPLAAVLGRGAFADTEWANAPRIDPENVAIVGLRSVDDAESAALLESDVTAFTMSDVDERGVIDVVSEALSVAADGVDGVHLSLDLDWLDPTVAPGVGTPVRGGVSYREAHAALETVAERDRERGLLRSMEVVEVNPVLDEANETAALAVELAASALGERILRPPE